MPCHGTVSQVTGDKSRVIKLALTPMPVQKPVLHSLSYDWSMPNGGQLANFNALCSATSRALHVPTAKSATDLASL